MAVVFVSHASADNALTDEFVDTILRNGCGLAPKEIFYSSGADTGVPDGQDLLEYVREQVGETGLVVTMLTPTFQTRPVCVAEMGAAWGSTGKLFPLLVHGVLSTQLVEYMDNEGALDRLHDKVVELTGRKVESATWTRAKRKWHRRLDEIIEQGGVPTPRVVTIEEYEAIITERDELVAALDAAEEDADRLREERDAIAMLKDQQAVTRVKLPKKAVDRFNHLVGAARKQLAVIGQRQVAEAIVASFSGRGLTVPMDDQWERDRVFALADEGLLIDTGDGTFRASDDFRTHTEATDAVEQVIAAMPDDPDFDEWFMAQFGAQPNMSNYTILRRVFLD
jgi:hypothetical protein